MSTVILDQATSAKLRAASGVVELRDETGELICVLNMPRKYTDEEIDWPSDEEIERILREGRSYTTEEVLAHLRNLEEGLNGR